MQFEFATVNRIIFGPGKLKEAGPIIRSYGNRPLIVTGRDTERAAPLVSLLRVEGLQPALFPVSGEPTIETITQGVTFAKESQADCVIGFGGGSALDAGKAIAIMV